MAVVPGLPLTECWVSLEPLGGVGKPVPDVGAAEPVLVLVLALEAVLDDAAKAPSKLGRDGTVALLTCRTRSSSAADSSAESARLLSAGKALACSMTKRPASRRLHNRVECIVEGDAGVMPKRRHRFPMYRQRPVRLWREGKEGDGVCKREVLQDVD